jgi:hypothetical protein
LRGQRLLEDRIRAAAEDNRPLQGRELEDEMLRVFYQVRDEEFEDEMKYLGVFPTRFPVYEPPFAFGVVDADGTLILSDEDKRKLAGWAKENGWSLERLKSYLQAKGAKL